MTNTNNHSYYAFREYNMLHTCSASQAGGHQIFSSRRSSNIMRFLSSGDSSFVYGTSSADSQKLHSIGSQRPLRVVELKRQHFANASINTLGEMCSCGISSRFSNKFIIPSFCNCSSKPFLKILFLVDVKTFQKYSIFNNQAI